ncbi:hypothetical protein Barb4_02594 [Bacteroidales bacterium Barb4]|nr:hypothetical protein Barb4_02594 [Bacteroidales bacterium Barb4]
MTRNGRSVRPGTVVPYEAEKSMDIYFIPDRVSNPVRGHFRKPTFPSAKWCRPCRDAMHCVSTVPHIPLTPHSATLHVGLKSFAPSGQLRNIYP